MNDDEFMKELEEVTKDLENEYTKSNNKTNSGKTGTNKTTGTNTDSKPNMGNMPPNMNDPSMMFADLFKNLDVGTSDANNLNQLKHLFGEFDQNDPESKEMMQQLCKYMF